MPTKIPWTDETINPWVGCTKIRSGCRNCYAERQACRSTSNINSIKNGRWTGEIDYHLDRLQKPLHWKKPRRIFWCSMSDFFHEKVDWRNQANAIMIMKGTTCTHQHIILTKRPDIAKKHLEKIHKEIGLPDNIQLLVSCSTQKDVDEMVPLLLDIQVGPHALKVRGISLEPMIEPIVIKPSWRGDYVYCGQEPPFGSGRHISWVIIGCERLPGNRAGRGCENEQQWWSWAQDIIDQCRDVSCFMKQGPINGKVVDDPEYFPEQARVRQWPK